MIDASETSDGIVPRRKRELRFVHLVGGPARGRQSEGYLGKSLRPIKKRSIACAACLPSRMAHTTRL